MKKANLRKPQKGQSIVLAMFLMLVAAASMVVLYNTAQTATEKTRLVNASDAAAYSGAVWTARQLNFMAYTNRAMIANHVMVGHLVSYVSWIRYVEDVTDNIHTVIETINYVTQFVPYLGTVTSALEQATDVIQQIAEVIKDITETMADIYVPGVNALNNILGLSQRAAWANMQASAGGGSISSPLHQVLTKTAKYYTSADTENPDVDIRVNHPSDLDFSVDGFNIGASIASEQLKLFNFSKKYSASNANDNRMKILVGQSYAQGTPSYNWISNRGWGLNWGIIRMRKNHETTSTLGSNSNWRASDSLEYKWITDGKWHDIGEGSATATEFSSGYDGVPDYYDLKSLDAEQSNLTITTQTSMPIEHARLKSLMGLETDVTRLLAVSRAEVYHRRPMTKVARLVNGSTDKYNEYSNLYNPFWQARLTKVPTVIPSI